MISRLTRVLGCGLLAVTAGWTAPVPLANGKDLAGWQGSGFTVADGALCGKAGAVFTDKAFENLHLTLEFRLAAGASGGVLARADAKAAPGTSGVKVQLLDQSGAPFLFPAPDMATGALRGLPGAKPAALKPLGQWNSLDLVLVGGKARVQINDKVTAETAVAGAASGAIGLVVQAGGIDFRNLNLDELAKDAALPATAEDLNKAQPGDNVPPPGFVALFNGKDLDGWKGLVADPPKRAKMTPEQLAAAQAQADQRMKDHWKVVDGVICFDGKGDSLCTAKDYKDFEMYVDWKILDNGDSGIYLRGSPQVQIWDPGHWKIGSGGLYNNQKNPSKPTAIADHPINTWNTFRIKMIGEKVWVWVNGTLVTDNVTMENYWERDKPIYPTGQIELQNHGNFLWFKNVYIREITDPDKEK